MSHVSNCSTQIKDLDTLEEAAKELGFTVKRNDTCHLYYENQNYQSELVISGRGMRFDVGVKKQDDGTYTLVTDFYAGSVGKACNKDGKKLGDLLEMYGVVAIEKMARAKRMRTKRIRKKDRTTVQVFA